MSLIDKLVLITWLYPIISSGFATIKSSEKAGPCCELILWSCAVKGPELHVVPWPWFLLMTGPILFMSQFILSVIFYIMFASCSIVFYVLFPLHCPLLKQWLHFPLIRLYLLEYLHLNQKSRSFVCFVCCVYSPIFVSFMLHYFFFLLCIISLLDWSTASDVQGTTSLCVIVSATASGCSLCITLVSPAPCGLYFTWYCLINSWGIKSPFSLYVII